MNIIYSFIDSFNTYSFKSLPCFVQALVCGDLHLVATILRRSEPVIFLINILRFPIFTLLSLNLYISRADLVHRKTLALLQPLGNSKCLCQIPTEALLSVL